MHSSCSLTGTQSSSPYLLLGNVDEPVSLSVQIIMRPIVHISWAVLYMYMYIDM